MANNIINTGQAIRDGLEEIAVEDSSVIFFAEGVSDPSSVYGTLKGIGDRIGHSRMIEMPVSENALFGVAVGAALMGKRPVISLHRVEFSLLAVEQIVNNAAKAHYVSNGIHKVPLVLRIIVGRGWGQGPNHSQSLEAMYSYFPGLKVIMPVFPSDAKAMIKAAVRDDNPVVCIENRWIHYVQGKVESDNIPTPLLGPKVISKGSDITLVASSYMVLEAQRAAEQLKLVGVSSEVIDLRVLRPLDITEIARSVSKTGRLLTIDSGFKTLGLGAEIVSEITKHCFSDLRSPPERMGMPDHPTPSSRGLIANIYPEAKTIVQTVAGMVELKTEKTENCIRQLEAERGDLPNDVHDRYFNGPF